MIGKDSLIQDYIWSIGYYLTLQSDGNTDLMFPSFFEHIINVSDEKNDSQVAQAFTRCFKIIHDMAKNYCTNETVIKIKESIDEFGIKNIHNSTNVRAHGCKKLGIQTLGNLLTISIQDISMRGGWALKSFNTFFDYWVGSLPASVRTGKMDSRMASSEWSGISWWCPPYIG